MIFKEAMTPGTAKQLSPLVLAYFGDAVYELMVREYLLKNKRTAAAKMHHTAVGLVCANAQCHAASAVLPALLPEELSIYMRGRNAKPQSMPKNTDTEHYKKATGFECLFGYLYLTNNAERLEFLFSAVLKNAEKPY